MSTYPGEDPQQPQDRPGEPENTAPITPSGPVWNPSSAQPVPDPTTPYEQPAHPPYGQAAPAPYGQAPPSPYGQAPYAQPPYPYAYAASAPSHPQSTLSMILGIVGLVGALMFCGLPLVVSPFAWALGRNALKEIAASGGGLRGESEARAGMVMGIIGTALLALAVLVLVGFAVVLIAGVQTS